MNRIEIIQKIINTLNAETYMEIGTASGKCFNMINSRIKIGVDPKVPSAGISCNLNDKCKYYQMLSDDFFDNYNNYIENEFGKVLKIDVAFIDGFHEYGQCLKDIGNCLAVLSEKGVIVLHDCNPTDERMATPLYTIEESRRWEGAWTGDVWKVIAYLRSCRSDLHVFVLGDDCGCGIITRLLSAENMLSYSVSEIKSLSYQDLNGNRNEILNLKDERYFQRFINTISVINGQIR